MESQRVDVSPILRVDVGDASVRELSKVPTPFAGVRSRARHGSGATSLLRWADFERVSVACRTSPLPVRVKEEKVELSGEVVEAPRNDASRPG